MVEKLSRSIMKSVSLFRANSLEARTGRSLTCKKVTVKVVTKDPFLMLN